MAKFKSKMADLLLMNSTPEVNGVSDVSKDPSWEKGKITLKQDSAIIFSTSGVGESAFDCANHRVSCKCQQPLGWKIHRFFRWKTPFAVFRSGSGVSDFWSQKCHFLDFPFRGSVGGRGGCNPRLSRELRLRDGETTKT